MSKLKIKVFSGHLNEDGFKIDKYYDPNGNKLAVCNYEDLKRILEKLDIPVILEES